MIKNELNLYIAFCFQIAAHQYSVTFMSVGYIKHLTTPHESGSKATVSNPLHAHISAVSPQTLSRTHIKKKPAKVSQSTAPSGDSVGDCWPEFFV